MYVIPIPFNGPKIQPFEIIHDFESALPYEKIYKYKKGKFMLEIIIFMLIRTLTCQLEVAFPYNP